MLQLGIGNTTAAAALVAALTGTPPTDVCGRGTGINSDGLQQKIETVTAALAVNAELIASGPAGALRAVAGLEIAAMVGAYLQAAKVGIPVIVDGFISGAAALVAVQLEGERVRRCLFWSHRSEERGVGALLDAALSHSSDENGEGGAPALGERPPLDMGLRLGEGTGAVLALPLLRSAAAVLANMATLKDLE